MSLLLAMLLTSSAQPSAAQIDAGLAAAKRLVAAIEGSADFQSADFVTPPRDVDKAALRRLGGCKVTKLGYVLAPTGEKRDEYYKDFNDVAVMFGCKGVPQDTPVAISLHLEDGKIATIETHNADLVNAR